MKLNSVKIYKNETKIIKVWRNLIKAKITNSTIYRLILYIATSSPFSFLKTFFKAFELLMPTFEEKPFWETPIFMFFKNWFPRKTQKLIFRSQAKNNCFFAALTVGRFEVSSCESIYKLNMFRSLFNFFYSLYISYLNILAFTFQIKFAIYVK